MKRLNLEEIKKLYENEKREILDCEIRKSGSKGKNQTFVKYRCLIDNYEGWISIGNLKSGQGCAICSNNKKLSLEQIKAKYDNEKIEILDSETREYGSKKYKATYVKYRCLVDGYEDWRRLNSIKEGKCCAVCSGQVLYDGNRLSLIRPDLIKYFEDEECANNYTTYSDKSVKLKCPDCGKYKNMQIKNLSLYGFSCDYCSDGISIPEKFGINLFKQLGVNFETQKSFAWSQRKRYDFYIQDIGLIVETHGGGHYNGGFDRIGGKTLEQEIRNDTLKFELALLSGYIELDNYIVIDCRNSEYNWLRINYEKFLCEFFDLSSVNWDDIWIKSQKSIIPYLWDFWNNRDKDFTIKKMSKEFGLSNPTIIKYLKRGNEVGKCIYDKKEEQIKNNKKFCKKVYQYSLNNEFLSEYDSCKDVEIQFGIDSRRISDCCLGKRKSIGGFIWSYNKI